MSGLRKSWCIQVYEKFPQMSPLYSHTKDDDQYNASDKVVTEI